MASVQGAYGVVTMPFSVREGVSIVGPCSHINRNQHFPRRLRSHGKSSLPRDIAELQGLGKSRRGRGEAPGPLPLSRHEEVNGWLRSRDQGASTALSCF